jgi:isopropylmalate/homocitrate/citramalate synthase
LAVANTLAAASAGVEYLSVTVNGLGERSGNAAFEEVVTALRVLYGIDAGIQLDQLTELSRLVERLSGVSLHQHKSVVGRGSFWHESGTVVAGVLNDPFTAECYAPDLVGQDREIILGKLSGIASMKARLAADQIDATEDQAKLILEDVRQLSVITKGPVGDEDFRYIVQNVMGK